MCEFDVRSSLYMRLEPSFLWLGDIYATLPVETIHIVTRNVPNTCNNTLPINMEWLSICQSDILYNYYKQILSSHFWPRWQPSWNHNGRRLHRQNSACLRWSGLARCVVMAPLWLAWTGHGVYSIKTNVLKFSDYHFLVVAPDPGVKPVQLVSSFILLTFLASCLG